jgi:hypothetical protein
MMATAVFAEMLKNLQYLMWLVLESQHYTLNTNCKDPKTRITTYKEWYKSNAFNFFSENLIAVMVEFTWMDDSYIFCNYESVFPQSLHHFQHTCTNVE